MSSSSDAPTDQPPVPGDAGEPPVYIDFLNRFDVASLGLNDLDILAAVEQGLRWQGNGETSIEPRMHIQPRAGVEGHFNVLRGWIGGDLNLAGTKVVGDFVDNYQQQRPSEYGVLTLFDPLNGAPVAFIDATGITEMRTGAMTALGARYLAPEQPRVLAQIGARGTAYWNVRLLAAEFEFEEIRVHSRRESSRAGFAERLRAELDVPVVVTDDWESAVRDADIVVESTRLVEPRPLLETTWLKPGCLLVPYGTMSAMPANLPDVVDKFVMDDWGQAHGKFGALRAHIDSGRLTREDLHAELGEVVAGLRPGRESNETILFWHRGLSLSDIALGHAMLQRAREHGIGQRLRFY